MAVNVMLHGSWFPSQESNKFAGLKLMESTFDQYPKLGN